MIGNSNILRSFYIDGESSADYGLLITGEAVWNAAAYDYEFVQIPGRSGDLILDNGRFQNITITYPCAVRDLSQMKRIRSWLSSKRGYHRITDDYNPGEYRLGCLIDGISVDPFKASAGTFTVSFNCKPQRYEAVTNDVNYIVLDLYQSGAKYQAIYRLNLSGRIYDLTTRDASAAFADVVEFAGAGITKSRSEVTILTDRRGAYINAQAEGLITVSSRAVAVRLTNSGTAFSIAYDVDGDGSGIWYASNDLQLINPTAYAARPMIYFMITDSDEIPNGLDALVGDINVHVEAPAADWGGVITVDCDLQDCFYQQTGGSSGNANGLVTLRIGGPNGELTTEFPALQPGENTLTMERITANPSNSAGGYVIIEPRFFSI